jgi:hypothetical protein
MRRVTATLLFATTLLHAEEPRQISGIYPHLAMFNKEGECGTGAVVPWADRLWVITYGPHLPFGSSDKLYEITPGLEQIIRPESVGGTPANRMIHRETQQLLIGPYVIDAERQVRVIPPNQMPGRLTGNARHLTEPATKAYYATMEEGLYEVDLKTLDVIGHIKDGNTPKKGFSKEDHPATLASELLRAPAMPASKRSVFCACHGMSAYAASRAAARAAGRAPLPLAACAPPSGWQTRRQQPAAPPATTPQRPPPRPRGRRHTQ